MAESIQVDGLRQLNRTLNKAANRGLVKAVGRANKTVGTKVSRWVQPRPTPGSVGRGRGAEIRPSAKKSALVLRVGGSHRAGKSPYMQWGVRAAREPGRRAPKRPYIKQSLLDRYTDIYELWLDEVERELWPMNNRRF